MGRPPSDLDDHLDWQERLESHKASGLSVDEFCLREGVSRSTFYRWVDRLKDGVPEPLKAEETAREQAESGHAAFVPINPSGSSRFTQRLFDDACAGVFFSHRAGVQPECLLERSRI